MVGLSSKIRSERKRLARSSARLSQQQLAQGPDILQIFQLVQVI
jgi:hypothetical protein